GGLAEEQGLFVTVVRVLAYVRQQTPVEQGFSPLDLKLFKHTRSDSLADVDNRVPAGCDFACFFKEGSSSSWIIELSETESAMSLSDSKPSARISVISGMSTGDPGIFV